MKSEKTGNVLKVFLWAVLVVTLISICTTSIFVYNFDVYLTIQRLDMFFALFTVVLTVMTFLTYLIWIYKVHKDLRNFDSNYQVSPWGSIARVAIPVYCIYGLWNVYSTMSSFFKERDSTAGYGAKLKTYIPFYYFLLFFSNILNRVVSRMDLESESYGPTLLASYCLDFFMFISFLLITYLVMKALNTIKTEIDAEPLEDADTAHPYIDDRQPPLNV